MEIAGDNYYVVVSDGKNESVPSPQPENRALWDISGDELMTRIRQLGIIDSRSATPLWKMMEALKGRCTRVLIDCTDPCPESAVAYRLCLEKAFEIIGGAKILLHSLNAAKGVIVLEEYKNSAASALAEQVADPMLFAFAYVEEKQPYNDRALMEAVYLSELLKTETAADKSCLIVGAETAVSLFEGIAGGIPRTRQYISLCGQGVEDQNLCVPCGMMTKDILELCGGADHGSALAENSLLDGNHAGGTVKNGTRALVSYFPKKQKRLPCIGCGQCAEVCVARIYPKQILSKSKKERSFVAAHCLDCRCCEYICPCGIPLTRIIKKEQNKERKEQEK